MLCHYFLEIDIFQLCKFIVKDIVTASNFMKETSSKGNKKKAISCQRTLGKVATSNTLGKVTTGNMKSV